MAMLLVGATLATPGLAYAQFYEGARLLGLGESQRALATGNDAIYVNPAGLALGSQYSIESGYADDFLGSDRRFNGSVVDSQAGALAAGFGYTYSIRRPEDLERFLSFQPDLIQLSEIRLEGHRAELALATRIIDTLAIGINVRYLHFDRDDGDNRIGRFQLFQLDAGLQWRIIEGLSIGVVGYNLIKRDKELTPISLGGGLGYQTDIFMLEGDFVYNFLTSEVRASGGLSVTLYEMIPVRAGVGWDQATEQWRLSVGLGFFIEEAAVDIAYRRSLNPRGFLPDDGDRHDQIFVASVRVFVFQ